jgi:hypothetical protein
MSVQPNAQECARGENGQILSADEQKALGWYAKDLGGKSDTAVKSSDLVMCITSKHPLYNFCMKQRRKITDDAERNEGLRNNSVMFVTHVFMEDLRWGMAPANRNPPVRVRCPPTPVRRTSTLIVHGIPLCRLNPSSVPSPLCLFAQFVSPSEGEAPPESPPRSPPNFDLDQSDVDKAVSEAGASQ